MNAAMNMQMGLPCSLWWTFSWLACTSDLYLVPALQQGQGHLSVWAVSSGEISQTG